MNENQTLDSLSREFSSELDRILEFWSIKAVDNLNGGFVGQINHYDEVNYEAEKGVVLNARILWTFSAAYRFTGEEKLKEMAIRAYNYLVEFFLDKNNGGLYWALDSKGRPVNKRKQAYAQGFGIYAFSEYFLATGDNESLEQAQNLYSLIEEHFRDDVYGGYIEALDENWNRLEDMRLSEKDANLPKSMNTHLHILEPYTNLYRAWPNEGLKESILHLLDIFQFKIIDKKTGHFNLFFEMDWECKSEIVSFGHDIEGAWLLREAALVTGDEDTIREIQKPALKLVDVTIGEGQDEDGSLFNERKKGKLDTDKHWWPQAEAMVGLMDALEMTGNKKYLFEIERIWTFIKENLFDLKNGEWYWSVDKNGSPATSEDKAGFWKCPYHNTRSMIEMIHRIKQ